MESNMEGTSVATAQVSAPVPSQAGIDRSEGRVDSEMISGREYGIEPEQKGRGPVSRSGNTGSEKIVSIAKEEGFEAAFQSIADGSAFSEENSEENSEANVDHGQSIQDSENMEQTNEIETEEGEQVEAEEVQSPEVSALTEKVLDQEAQIEELVRKNKELTGRVDRLEEVQRKMVEALLLMQSINKEDDEEKKKGMLESLFSLIGFLIGMLSDPDKESEEMEENIAA